MKISYFKNDIVLSDARAEVITSEKRRTKYEYPPETREPYASPEQEKAYRKGIKTGDFSDYRKKWGNPPPLIKETHYTSPSNQVLILTAESGEIYRITKPTDAPMRDDFPCEIRGIFRGGKHANGPVKHEIGIPHRRRMEDVVQIIYSDGWAEDAILRISNQHVMNEVEAITIEEEDLILSMCDNRFPTLRNPTMREFYTAYVIQRKTCEKVALTFNCVKRTAISRKRELERTYEFYYKKKLNLTLIQKDCALREAREKRHRNRLKR